MVVEINATVTVVKKGGEKFTKVLVLLLSYVYCLLRTARCN
jgi:hypothetical protein